MTGYRIEWSGTGTGGWRSLVADTRSTTTRHTDDGLPPGTTRHYRVRAISAAGSGAWSNVAHATTDELTVPGAPRSLRVNPNALRGSTELRLTWTAPASNGGSPITGYRIERAAARGGPWIILVASTGGAATTHEDTGLAPNTTRYYRVRALNAQGHGDPSNEAQGTTNAARPGQPRNLRARAAGPTSITLDWEAPTSDGGEQITGYTIQRRGPNDGTWITLPRNTGPQETTFTDTGLRPASAYRYQVAAINRVGAGEWSFEASTSTYAQAPGAPFNLTARAVGTARIDLSWSTPRNTGGAPILGYRIEASDDGGRTWNIIIRRNTNSKTTTASDVNLQPATTRHYRVAAINTAGTGPFSNTARATTDATVPGTPRNLDAEAGGTSRIELSWRAPTSDGGSRITGYRIEVSEDGGTRWDDLVSNSHNTRTTYVHTGLEPATRRHYRVSAINRIGVGRASRVASAITDATVPDAPTGLTATAVSPTRIDLFWLAPAYDGGAPVAGYRIEVSENGTAWTDLMVNTGSRATTYSHTGLLPGSTRHYRVSAINRAGTGAPSASASAATDDPIGRAGRLNTRVLPHVASAMTSSTVSAIARRVDAVANGMGMERRVETNGLSSMAASLSAPGAGGPRPRARRPGRAGRPLRRHLLHDAPGRLRCTAAVRHGHAVGELGSRRIPLPRRTGPEHPRLEGQHGERPRRHRRTRGTRSPGGCRGLVLLGQLRLHRQDRRQSRDRHLRRHHGQRAPLHGVVLRRGRRLRVGLGRARPGRHRRRRRARRVPHHAREPVDGGGGRELPTAYARHGRRAPQGRGLVRRGHGRRQRADRGGDADHAARQARAGADAGLPCRCGAGDGGRARGRDALRRRRRRERRQRGGRRRSPLHERGGWD